MVPPGSVPPLNIRTRIDVIFDCAVGSVKPFRMAVLVCFFMQDRNPTGMATVRVEIAKKRGDKPNCNQVVVANIEPKVFSTKRPEFRNLRVVPPPPSLVNVEMTSGMTASIMPVCITRINVKLHFFY
jgi:hypothetical protein